MDKFFHTHSSLFQHIPAYIRLLYPCRPIPSYSSVYKRILAYSRQFQPIPVQASLFQHIPVNSGLFQPIPAYASIFQPIPDYFSLLQLIPAIPAYSSLFQHIPAYSSPFQHIPSYYGLFQPPLHKLKELSHLLEAMKLGFETIAVSLAYSKPIRGYGSQLLQVSISCSYFCSCSAS